MMAVLGRLSASWVGVIEVTKVEGWFCCRESADPEAAAEEGRVSDSATGERLVDSEGKGAFAAGAKVVEPVFVLVKGARAGGRLVEAPVLVKGASAGGREVTPGGGGIEVVEDVKSKSEVVVSCTAVACAAAGGNEAVVEVFNTTASVVEVWATISTLELVVWAATESVVDIEVKIVGAAAGGGTASSLVVTTLDEVAASSDEVVAAAGGDAASVGGGTSVVDEVVKAGGGGPVVVGSDTATSLVVSISVGNEVVGGITCVVGGAGISGVEGVVTGRASTGADEGLVTGGAIWTGAEDGLDTGGATSTGEEDGTGT
jgi:hypothetical protein